MRQFGRFRLVELLASGGMADVWRAEMPGAAGFVKDVALKLVRGEHRQDDAFTRMFVEEARLASRLDHANIVHVFDLGEVDGQYYIAMELVRGRSLKEVADRCREIGIRFGVARAVHVCAEVARALAYAHRLEVNGRPAGLVHRDVSPQNVLVSFEGEVKLADFGIARAADATEQTRAGTIKGKLAYMAPEQARGDPVDARADVFALGVVLWELCAGRRLFAREGDAATLAALLDAAPVSPPSHWNESVPPELDAIVVAALERDPDRRTGSADELAASLAALRLRLATSAPDEIDLRALLRRLWPDGAAPRPREGTSVMASPPVPIAAEPGVERTPPGRDGAPQGDDSPTRTLVRRRPFSPAQRTRRPVALLSVLVFAGLLSLLVLRWAKDGAGDGGEASTRDAGHVGRALEAEDAPVMVPAPAPERATSPALAPALVPGREETPPAAPAAPDRAAPPTAPNPRPEQRSATAGGAPPARARRAPATLVVDVVPWATVYVNGERVGDTPLTLQLPAGAHEVRAVHPRLGSASARLDLAPGERLRWAPGLSR